MNNLNITRVNGVTKIEIDGHEIKGVTVYELVAEGRSVTLKLVLAVMPTAITIS